MVRLGFLPLLLCSLEAAAAEPPDPAAPPSDPAAEPEEEYTPEEGLPNPAAPDLRGSHLLISAAGALAVPSAGLLPLPEDAGAFSLGGGLRAAVGLGLSRHVVLRADGGASWFDGARDCDSCTGLTADAGLSVAYVLAQGIAFEPWAAYGMGYRYANTELASGDQTAHGFDVARLSLGGDFFPLPSFGFGPFLETDLGVRVSPDTTGYVGFFAGLRITYDPMRSGTEITPSIASR